MPANWDTYQNVRQGRVEWPTGPMTLNTGFEPRWIDAWVIQGGADRDVTYAGPTQSTSQSSDWIPTNDRWTADTTNWKNGNFESGPALGISLLASRSGTEGSYTYEYIWWFDHIILY